MRYIYRGGLRTAREALDVLEDMFAVGEVCEGEHPQIERREGGRFDKTRRYRSYVITVSDGQD